MNDTFEIETIDQSAVLRETISNIKNVFLSLSLSVGWGRVRISLFVYTSRNDWKRR